MLKKIVNRVVLALALLLPFAAIAHYFVFPQESNCILVRFSGLEKQGNLYYNKNTPTIDIDTLKTLIDVASTRVATFWGEKKGTPIYIYCNSDEEFKKYGNDRLDPATTQVKLGTYIVIRKDGIDLDVLAHEICHAELAERIGFFAWISKVPLWFNEGLAMQCDERPEFSEDSLKIKTNKLTMLLAFFSMI